MSFMKSEKVIGWGVVTFVVPEDYVESEFEENQPENQMSVPGHLREGDSFIVAETDNATFHIPINLVCLIISFKDKDTLDDHMLHSEIALFNEEQ